MAEAEVNSSGNVPIAGGERPVRIPFDGGSVFGIFHPARNGRTDVGVIFVNSGLQYRVGPHRIYVEAARRLAEAGIASLRLDHPGVGDSDGEHTYSHFDAFPIRDKVCAADHLRDHEGIEHVVLLGMCAGARNALAVAAQHQVVDSLVLWSIPVQYTPPGSPTSLYHGHVISREASKDVLRRWGARVLELDAWRRRFRRSGFPLRVGKVARGLLSKQQRGADSRLGTFSRALATFVSSGRSVAFLYGERDSVPIAECRAELRRLNGRQREMIDFHVVSSGDHTFSKADTKQRVIEYTVQWLRSQYPLESKDRAVSE